MFLESQSKHALLPDEPANFFGKCHSGKIKKRLLVVSRLWRELWCWKSQPIQRSLTVHFSAAEESLNNTTHSLTKIGGDVPKGFTDLGVRLASSGSCRQCQKHTLHDSSGVMFRILINSWVHGLRTGKNLPCP